MSIGFESARGGHNSFVILSYNQLNNFRSEVSIGFEPMHNSFADCSLSHLGTTPFKSHLRCRSDSNPPEADITVLQTAPLVRLWRSTTPFKNTKSGKRDSNPRHQPWQGCALPTELFPRNLQIYNILILFSSPLSLILGEWKIFQRSTIKIIPNFPYHVILIILLFLIAETLKIEVVQGYIV